MSNLLPFDIITNILSRLPVKSLLRFKCVSKPWLCLIKDPKFVKMHLNRSIQSNNLNIMLRGGYLFSMDYDSSFDEAKEIHYPYKPKNAQIFGSCNGLICFTNEDENIFLWNPCTQKFRKLPKTPIQLEDKPICRTIIYGFGYDHTIDDYKVVRIVNFGGYDGDEFDSEVKVYTLGTNKWKQVELVPYYILYKHVAGVLVNGALHWAATRKPESDLSKVIVSFDLVGEVFKEVPQPDYENAEFHMNLGVLGGSLCVHSNFYKVLFEVWVMKDYSVKESWIKLLSISQETELGSFDYLLPLCYSKEGDILLEKDNKNLIMYEPKSEKAKTLEICGIPSWFESEAYAGSLVTLISATNVWYQQAEQKIKENNQKTGPSRKEKRIIARLERAEKKTE